MNAEEILYSVAVELSPPRVWKHMNSNKDKPVKSMTAKIVRRNPTTSSMQPFESKSQQQTNTR